MAVQLKGHLPAGDKYVITADGTKHSLTIKAVAKEDANVYAVIAGVLKGQVWPEGRIKARWETLMLQLCVWGLCVLTCRLYGLNTELKVKI